MTYEKEPAISQVFTLLNDWRHLPFYSLETRAAPFFAVFMRQVLSNHFGHEMHEVLIPEFPMRIGTMYNHEEREKLRPVPSADQSFNVDYVAFREDKKTAYLVELKTDMHSIRSAQMNYLSKARDKTFPTLVEGIMQVASKSDKKQKYVHLLHRLSLPGIELVTIPDDTRLYEKTFGQGRAVSGWNKEREGLSVNCDNFLETEVVYVQPREGRKNEHGFSYIYFDEFARIVERHGDLGTMFANYLRQWTLDAGSQDPTE